ncbi:5330_t:CDS:2 [Funneliformis geosporum]|uniref:11927_t:CDS:1 n=1 Tax=Funneliformis geosporum TaxID=1117311 RepID=A0A9W4WU35_9GLOM|nr:5330_t:CDS:2 [Funneliformis geosporum]CAI2163684.1 11927_t:CDS:2 [Funneliformis geosporum]
MPLLDQLDATLEKRKKLKLLRSLVVASPSSVDFSSNDFLGLARNKVLQESYLKEISTFPIPPLGSTGSRLLDGNSSYVEALDKFIAEFHKAESALIFPSGFDANVGFFSSVPQRGDAIIMDEFIHASVHDGVKNSRAAIVKKFRHNDVDHLKETLEEIVKKIDPQRNIFVSVESLYSMDGDIAPLNDIVEVIKPFNTYLIVDEAHATGVYGEQGRGIVCELGLERKVFARLHTFGKALASNGAAILGPKILRTYLINYARPLIFSTFLPFNSLIAINCAYKVMSSEVGDQLRQNLRKLIHIFRSNINLPSNMLLPSDSAIQSILTPGNDNAVRLSRVIQKSGYNVKPIRSPTVPNGKERVRICIHSDNTEEQIHGIINVIENYFKNQHVTNEMNNDNDTFTNNYQIASKL